MPEVLFYDRWMCQAVVLLEDDKLVAKLNYAEITPVAAVKSHCRIKPINSGETKLQVHSVQMCQKWLKFVDDVNYGFY